MSGEVAFIVTKKKWKEDHDQDLGDLRRLELQGPDLDPQPGPPDGLADDRGQGQEEEDQPDQADRVRVLVELAVLPDHEQRDAEQGQAEQEPQGLGPGQVRPEAVDHREPQPGQEHPAGKEHRVGLGREPPNREVGGQVESPRLRAVAESYTGNASLVTTPPEPQDVQLIEQFASVLASTRTYAAIALRLHEQHAAPAHGSTLAVASARRARATVSLANPGAVRLAATLCARFDGSRPGASFMTWGRAQGRPARERVRACLASPEERRAGPPPRDGRGHSPPAPRDIYPWRMEVKDDA